MFFRLFSDIHNEFSPYQMIPLDTDKDDVLVLAGDIGVANRLSTFDPIIEWSKRFRKTIHICGNHEYYHGSLIRTRSKIIEMYDGEDNLILANNDIIRVDDVSFVCGTLWTDFNKHNPVVMNAVHGGLNDYNFIRTGPLDQPYMRKINPHDIYNEHQITKDFIFKSILAETALGQKVVVVSHHAPSPRSVHRRYAGQMINWGYVSDLDEAIEIAAPKHWVHGHTHYSFCYPIGDTTVWANPRGYQHPSDALPENKEFNPVLRIEV